MTALDIEDPRAVSRRDRLGAGIMYFCALGATTSAALALPAVLDAGAATKVVEVWRMVGFGMFAGVFVLLGRAPRQLRGLWELTIASKVALPFAGLTLVSGADDAGSLIVVDGLLAVLVIAAYALTAGWTAAPARRHSRQAGGAPRSESQPLSGDSPYPMVASLGPGSVRG
jgi:hypothetical protein